MRDLEVSVPKPACGGADPEQATPPLPLTVTGCLHVDTSFVWGVLLDYSECCLMHYSKYSKYVKCTYIHLIIVSFIISTFYMRRLRFREVE